MTVVSLHQSHEKPTLGWQKENGNKVIITIKGHSITNDVQMRQHFQWSVVRCATPYSNISKKCILCLYENFVIITYPRQHKLLNKQS